MGAILLCTEEPVLMNIFSVTEIGKIFSIVFPYSEEKHNLVLQNYPLFISFIHIMTYSL